jgi:uncharacterized protein
VVNRTRQAALAERAEKADRFVRRALGLMGRRALPSGGGLIIVPCNSVVSFFMRFPIDVVFVGDDGQILRIVRRMAPWRASRIVLGSRMVIELPGGTVDATQTVEGDTLEVTPA